jgi:hypothetical protein
MLFRVETGDNKGGAGGSSAADGAHRATHCGVLEFIAEEGRAYLPRWVSERCCCCVSRGVGVVWLWRGAGGTKTPPPPPRRRRRSLIVARSHTLRPENKKKPTTQPQNR